MAEDKNLDIELEKNQSVETPPEKTADSVQADMAQEVETLDEVQQDSAIVQETESVSETLIDTDDSQEEENAAQEMITVRPVKFQKFEMEEPNRSIKKNLDIMQDVSMHISVELGRAKSTIKEVMDYKEGSIIELDKIAGEQVEVYANNKLIAKGEVIVIEDKFGVRVTSTNLPKGIQ